MCLLAEGLVNDEVRDAFLRLQEAMNRMHIRVAALEAATVLLLRTNAGNANVADEFERSIRHYLQGMDQHRDHVFAFEEIRSGHRAAVTSANAIAASPETPYLQIGESKYGKPILDRILSPATRLEDAARTAIVSLDSTIRSNLSVGLPIDVALLRDGELRIGQQLRLGADSALYADIHQNWSRRRPLAGDSLPRCPWEPTER
ncbi:hypothetical protein G6F50_013758 [Rhizopus delemar]|uniref:Uncharacterized protein n=1 Tax=Rhizopus delemar TaxID=936053 RepID=A0A9P6YD35_9FUNG|nr:hypothetical protein G6F50_013758 [Rhizopus delemar]